MSTGARPTSARPAPDGASPDDLARRELRGAALDLDETPALLTGQGLRLFLRYAFRGGDRRYWQAPGGGAAGGGDAGAALLYDHLRVERAQSRARAVTRLASRESTA